MKKLGLILILSACGAQGPVDPSLAPYVESFKADMAANGRGQVVTTSIGFGDPTKACGPQEANEVGCCADGNVTIDPYFWSQSSDFEKKMVIYHELGHCVLGRTHLAETISYKHCQTFSDGSTGCTIADEPASIMHASLPPEIDSGYENLLIKELFTGGEQ